MIANDALLAGQELTIVGSTIVVAATAMLLMGNAWLSRVAKLVVQR